MSDPSPIFVSRLQRLPLVGPDGTALGRVDDLVFVPSGPEPPRVLGFVVTVQRRRIFLNAGRVGEIAPLGVRLKSATIDVRPFAKRSGEVVAAGDLFDKKVDDDFITDLAIEHSAATNSWYVVTVALGGRGPLRRRRTPRVVPWAQVATLFDAGPEMAEVAQLREMHPSKVAERIRDLPLERRRRLAGLLDDERLADLLEELEEDEQIRIIESLDLERAAHVLEEMEPDDAVDLLGELPESDRAALLEAMEPEESTPLRRLLTYEEDSAGGLMTPEPVILAGDTTVAEALAVIRRAEMPAELAAQVFVVQPPLTTPTGRFLGVVGFQRLLRERPACPLAECVDPDEPEFVPADLPLRDIAERLASYDLLAVAVLDEGGRLIGAVTVDDVLDHVLPDGWRTVRR